MPTEATHAIFLLAHQDDEFGVFEQIHLERQSGRQVGICYFTTGVPPGAAPGRRNEESLAVLRSLGIDRSDVHFIGELLGIADGRLLEHMEAATSWLQRHLSGKDVAAVYAPVWEGGHPDHDCLCATAVAACTRANLLRRLRHFMLYRGRGCPGPLFRVFSPMEENGPVTRTRIPWTRRIQYLRHCLAYPSQWRSWVGLFPFVALRLIVDGAQVLQPARPDRIGQRPHPGQLYYEKRRFASYDIVRERVDQLLSAHQVPA